MQTENEMETEQGGKVQAPRHEHNWITMLFCVVAAICIWFYVRSVDSPTSTELYSSVPVKIVNERNSEEADNLSAISGTGNVIEVTLKGRKTVLNALTPDDIEAYVDVSEVNVSGRGVYTVVVEAPAGTVIEEYYPTEISIYLDKKNIVTVPVQCKLEGYTVGSEYSLDISNPTLSLETVRVSGPESELEDISYARMTLSPGTITQSFSGSAPLELVDENGNVVSSKYLMLSDKEATASFNVYTTKYLPLTLEYKYNWYAENGTAVELSPSRVKVRGLVERLNQMTSVTVATIDETRIVDDGIYNYNLPLPDGVELAESNKAETVAVNVHFNNMRTALVTLPADRIELVGIPDGKQVQILDDAIRVTVRGVGQSAQYISSGGISAVVDLSNVGEGDQYVPAAVSVKEGNSASLYTVGEYSVQVRVTEEE